MSNLSIRGLAPDDLAVLKSKAAQEGASVNALVLRLINQGLGKAPGKLAKRRHDDLDSLAGSWNSTEAVEFQAATEVFAQVDPEQWK